MPVGSGLSYDHTKLTRVIQSFVENRNIGDIFMISDVTTYIETIPMHKYAKKRGLRNIGNTEVQSIASAPKQTRMEKSEPYFATIIRNNARRWNLRYGMLYSQKTSSLAKNHDGYIESIYGVRFGVLYCKTDDLGAFLCIGCGKETKMRPQWANIGKNSKLKVIRREINCIDCWAEYELIKIDHEIDRSNLLSNRWRGTNWKLKEEE